MASGTKHADAILKTFRNNTAMAVYGTSLWVSLHNGAPAATGANEMTWSNYKRQKLKAANWGTVTGTAGSNRRIQMKSTITFSTVGTTTAGQKAIGVGVWTASAAGSFIVGGTLNTSITLSAGTVPSFGASALDIEQD